VRIVVLDGFAVDQGALSWEEVAKLGALSLHPRTSPGELLVRAQGAEALLTNKVVLGRQEIEALPNLHYIGVTATGTNVIDFEACRARKIAVTNVPAYTGTSVAQMAIAMLLHFVEALPDYITRVKQNAWAESPDFCFLLHPRIELANRTMAILGMGSIGRRVADTARGLGMKVIAAEVPGSSSEGRVPLEEALTQADVLSLHCPLTERTRRLVDASFLARMKPGAILINTSRGGLVDETALLAALASGRLGGALLDVLTEEPPPRDHPLLDPSAPWANRVIVTPHMSWATVEARQRLIRTVADNLAAFKRGERLNRVD
jgi:glycerate dehydrogenase